MSSERSGKSRVAAWTLAIIAVPVLYVLTFPPIASLVLTRNGMDLGYSLDLYPHWLAQYGTPYRLAYRNSGMLMGKVFLRYEVWCREHIVWPH
jgi:hypothetical protein